MMASCSAASAFPLTERPTPARFLIGVEPAFRGALTESFEGLALCDRNLLQFHYFRGLSVDQLADMFGSSRAAVVRQLARIRDRMLRDMRRGLAARLPLDKHELDELLDVARRRFDLAITRVLRT
jgi:RNA polymerase sigma-70 factor, ECF subfamily